MSDEHKTDEMPSSEWVMPDPIFRSTPGQKPASMHETEIKDGVPTIEPGFREADTLETVGLPTDPGENSVEPGFRDAPTIETKGLSLPDAVPAKVKAAAPKAKKGGCLSTLASGFLLIAIASLAIIAALVYYFFYYRPADIGPF